ncbi:class I SAM-dependent methyltransferase [Desulfatibacillum aliphaticivorans]|uniref:class I SAM-dependent methyltransferase n=1 Tax=Desulfatibacillum aliphaticivorans TaxID=218208 RepID=UPI0004213AF8|nr:class I SAM-dependent methyltransferase [Desulfatibacillum aliphaticivorans]
MWNDATAPYSKFESWFYNAFIAQGMLPFMDRVQADLNLEAPEKGSLLDVGCGGGHILERLAEKFPQLTLAGVDLSEEQVARANERLRPYVSRTQIRQGSALNLPYPPDKFDVILSTGSIKHWPDKVLGLSECLRVLKPGGRLLIMEADRGCRHKDVDNLFLHTKIPALLRPIFRSFFLLKVSGPSLDLDDVRDLAAQAPLKDWSVSRIKDMPAWVLDGMK